MPPPWARSNMCKQLAGLFFLERWGGNDIDVLAPPAGPAPGGNAPPAFSEAGILGTCLRGLSQSPPPGVTPSLPQAAPAWLSGMAPSRWDANRKAQRLHRSPGALAGARGTRPPARSQFSASRRKETLSWLPRGSLLWACVPALFWYRSPGRGEGYAPCEGGLCPAQDGSSCLDGSACQHPPETPTSQVSFPGSLPPGDFQVPKPDPGPWPPPSPSARRLASARIPAVSRTPSRPAHAVPAWSAAAPPA